MRQDFVGNIILPDRILFGGVLSCENGKIVDITEHKVPETDDLPYILPGLVDIHNHGAVGHDYMEGVPEAFEAISQYLICHGVTTAQCTTVSAPANQLREFFAAYRNYQQGSGCRLCGIHIEGPYISVKNRGAHPIETLLTPKDGYDWILENSDIIREITISPELSGMPEMIERLCTAGIVVSGGHDDAEPEHIDTAVEAGMSHCTHIYCAMSTLHKTGMERRCGLCEYAMTHNNITAEMIADNHHIPPQLAQMIYRAKGAEKLCLVSDSLAAAGMKGVGPFSLGDGENCTKVYVENDVAVVEDHSCYAGSVQALDQMVRNMVKDANIPLVDAVRMASLTPAEVIGIAHECGSISIGKRADMCIMDHKLNVIKTVIAGNVVYNKEDA